MTVYLASYADLEFARFPSTYSELYYRRWVHTIIEQSYRQEQNGDAQISKRWFVEQWNQKVYKARRGLAQHPRVFCDEIYSKGNNGYDPKAYIYGFRGVEELEVVELDFSERYNAHNAHQIYESFRRYFAPRKAAIDKMKRLSDWEFWCAEVLREEVGFYLSSICRYDPNLFRVLNGFPTASRTNKHNRLYNSYVQMSREVRKHAHIGGEPLVEVDVSASHPFILGCAKPARFARALARPHENRFLSAAQKHLSSLLPSGSLLMRVIGTPPPSGHPPTKFHNDLQARRDIYKRLSEAMSGVYSHPSRDKAKDLLNKLINQRPEAWLTYEKPGSGRTELDPKRLTTLEKWAEIYPEALRLIMALPDNTPLAQLEAEMIVDTAYRRLAENDVPVIPTHDGIATTSRFAERAKEEIKSAYERELGAAPEVTVEGEEANDSSEQSAGGGGGEEWKEEVDTIFRSLQGN